VSGEAEERIITLGRCPNFRDLGGYATDDGRSTRGDLLFRSGWLDLSDPAERSRFDGKGVRHVFDFRNDAERAHQALDLPGAPTVIPLGIDRGSMGDYLAKLPTLTDAEVDTKAAMARMYAEMMKDGAEQFRRFFAGVLESEEPLMIMCTLGKDRTGVASALLLAALGVDKDAIFDNYLLSARAYRDHGPVFEARFRQASPNVPFARMRDVFTVHSEYLEAAWKAAEAKSGNMAGFLEREMGLTDARRAKLKNRFTQ